MTKMDSVRELPDGGVSTDPPGTHRWAHDGPHGSSLQYAETEDEGEQMQSLYFDVVPGNHTDDDDAAMTTLAYPHCTVRVWVRGDRVLRVSVHTHRDAPTSG